MNEKISASEIISSLQFCQASKDEFCKMCLFSGYGGDCIKHQNQAAVNHLISLVQLSGKQSELLEKLAAQLTDLVNASRWIPAAEQMPKEFVSVLVCIPSDDPLPTVKEAYLVDGMWVTKSCYYTKQEVTHWRPMPKGVEVSDDA